MQKTIKELKESYKTTQLAKPKNKDIKYVIVKYNSEIAKMKSWLLTQGFSADTIPAIISCEQLKKDF